MASVTELGYLGLSVSDMDAWRHYAGEIIGMEVLDEGEGDRFYLRMDYQHHRIVVHNTGEDDMAYIGWRVAGAVEFAEMRQTLEKAGIEHTVGDRALCKERRVLEVLQLTDPGGNPTEIYHGPEVDYHLPFHPGRRMHGRWVTGDQGIGHVILREDDIPGAVDFYTNVMGMRGGIEYQLQIPQAPDGVAMPVFMHCNNRDHSIAFGVGPSQKRINHLMIELDNLDDVGLTHDLVRQNNIPVAIQLGKHANDQAYTFYHGNPSGWLWEVGCYARKASHQSEYYPQDVFGHKPEAGGFGMDVEM